MDQYHRRLSTSTKMNGPDWFGGVDSFSLLTSGGFWLKNFTLEMYPYDAGRLSGETYSDPGPVTDPQDPVQQITVDNVPESSDVFMSPDGETVLPLARLSCSLVLDGLGPKPFPAANSPSDSSVATSAPNASSSLTPQVGSGEGPSTGASRGWSVAAELTTLFLALAAATFMFC